MSMTLSVAIVTFNEKANLARTLNSISWADEVVIVDSGSTDGSEEIARRFGVRWFMEPWKGFAAQKNSAIDKCNCDWILSLDADEEISAELGEKIKSLLNGQPNHSAYILRRRNYFLGRWMKHGGYYPDPKLRLFRRGSCRFEERAVHETMKTVSPAGELQGDLIHHAYPTLTGYLEHMNRYSSLGAEQIAASGDSGPGLLAFVNGVVLNPVATFVYNYLFRLGFLDGREGLLQHLYHSVYISWKYAKAWEGAAKRVADGEPKWPTGRS